jgi:hypothetical protein
MGLIDKNATQAMTAANRANALKSTGPITDQGKLRARINSIKHGLRAQEEEPDPPKAPNLPNEAVRLQKTKAN